MRPSRRGKSRINWRCVCGLHQTVACRRKKDSVGGTPADAVGTTALPEESFGSGRSLADFRINDDGDWAIVDQANLHIRAKFASLNIPFQIFRQPADELLVKRHGHFGAGRPSERRTVALFGAGEKRSEEHTSELQ